MFMCRLLSPSPEMHAQWVLDTLSVRQPHSSKHTRGESTAALSAHNTSPKRAHT